MKCIELTRGMVAIVDDEDFAELAQYKWSFKAVKNICGYAYRTVPIAGGRRSSLCMHTVIMRTPKGAKVDHENRNGLDNRRCNLRFATSSQNATNSGPSSKNKFGLKGVSVGKRGRFVARIACNGVRKRLGTYKTPEEAALAYNKAAMELHGEFAHLN